VKIATFSWGGERHVGVLTNNSQEVSPLRLSKEERATGALALIRRLAAGESFPHSNATRLPVSVIKLEAPIPRPLRNIFCVGRNYRAHADELATSVFKEKGDAGGAEQWPIVFSKLPECVIGPNEAVRLPTGISEQVDYEAELAVVIGKGGVNISARDASSHIFGYTIVNDVTARDVQVRHHHWDLGKSFDTFCPMGPWIVTADELDGQNTNLRSFVNGQLRQEASTRDMIFDIATLIETCSRGITLYPGDIIATGTPAGVGMGMNPPTFLRKGDATRIEIDGIGILENTFR
jgi:2-keto-4-pentenoate hydratase/2-oxohepta-3-ene-1,7-dioic acid hydratase in catechol pathway